MRNAIQVLYGRHAVHEALRAGRRRAYKLILAEGVRETGVIGQILLLARRAGLKVVRTDRQNLELVGDVNHQGVLLEAAPYPYVALDALLDAPADSPPVLLLLDLLQDPQNVGTLLRTAEAVGVQGVIIQRKRAVGITPAVVRASAGAVEHLRIAQVTNLAHAIATLKQHDFWVAGLEAAPTAQRYDEADLSVPLALVVGSEGRGLRRLVRERCDFLLSLPMVGRVSSLNAAVAGSVVLYEAFRSRRPTETPT